MELFVCLTTFPFEHFFNLLNTSNFSPIRNSLLWKSGVFLCKLHHFLCILHSTKFCIKKQTNKQTCPPLISIIILFFDCFGNVSRQHDTWEHMIRYFMPTNAVQFGILDRKKLKHLLLNKY